MSKKHQRVVRAIDKYQKNASKELERARFLLKKASALATEDATRSAVEQLIERLKQKELQATGDGVWADQLAGQLRGTIDKAAATDEKKSKKGQKTKKSEKAKKNEKAKKRVTGKP